MDDFWIKCNIHYYCREKYYNRMYKIARSASSKHLENVEYPFYSGIALILERQVQRGIQELTPLQSNRDVQLGVILALIFAHKNANSVDRDALHSLDSKLKEERKHSSALSLYYAALFLSLAEKYEKAADYVTKSLKKDPNYLNAIILKGWNEMFMNDEIPVSVSDCFDLALSKSERHVEATLGLARLRSFAHNHDSSNLLLDQIIVNNTGQLIPLVEKMKNDFALKRWEAVSDTMERIFTMEPDNIEAIKTRIFFTLCKASDYIEATDQLNKFYTCLETEEPHNGYQFFETSKLFSRICGRSSTVLSQAYRFVQRASEMYPSNVEYLSEIGHHCLLQGKSKDAHNFFKAASKIDSNSITALCGLTLCQMIESGPTEQIEQQIELLLEMQGSVKMPLLLLLSAKLSRKETRRATSYLDEAANTKIAHAAKSPYGLKYVKELDPDFLLEVYKEYQQHLPKKPFVIVGYLMYNEDTSNPSVDCCFKILETIVDACPGLIAAVFELAKLKFAFGFAAESLKLAQQIIELENTHAGSYILMAQINIQKQIFQKAALNLEICLSYNFKVRDSAMYHLITGIIQKSIGDNQEALSSFTKSLLLIQGPRSMSASQRTFDSELNIADKATLYLQLIEVRTNLGQFAEAGKLMQEAIQEFSFTSEEGRLVLAKADLALKNGDVDRYLDILGEVKYGQPYYFQAHTKMAHVYLKEKNDRAMFASCFRDVVSNYPMADSHTMMGDAYMSINEPALAVEAYESAIATNPRSATLIGKMAASLVRTHEFNRAMQLYEESIKTVPDDELKFEYAELLIKLKQYDKADIFTSSELSGPFIREKDMATLRRRVRLLLLQARARELKNPDNSSISLTLMEAKDLQTGIVRRIEVDSRGDLREEKQLLSTILSSLARVKSLREPVVAANLYAEALINVPRDPTTLLALAKLYAQMNNSDKCEQTCAILLSTDPNHESAAVMMADLSFRKVDFETAQRHLSQILSVKPTSWQALAQLVEVQWRRARLPEAELALETAKAAMGDQEDPGYSYCAGVVAMYAGRPNAALRLLNQCRRSPRWGQDAVKRMVLLCLSQESAQPNALSDTLLQDGDTGDTHMLAMRTAEKLLTELPAPERRALHALLQLAGRSKAQAERVLQDVLPLATDDAYVDDPYIILAIANAYNILKQPTRAKNILKRTISSIPWTPERADGLERCWLEVADQQVSAGRADAARDLLNRLIHHNKSCTQAYQYLGYLSEKEQNHKMAAVNYESAWSNSARSNFTVGYKLAHCYLKLKKYPEAIIICRHILKTHPDYPKIRKEILEKAKNNLRT